MYQSMYFRLCPKAHPYAYEESSKYEAWGKLEIMHNNISLLEYEWDMIQVIEWMQEKKKDLLWDLPFWETRKYSSLAEFISQIYSEMDIIDTPEEEFEKIESYLEKHTFTLRGTDMPLLYICLVGDNIGQLSYQKSSHHYLFYEFDMQEFIKKTETSISNFIKIWKRDYYSEYAYNKIVDITAPLN